jgi:hypothetical protein
MRYTETVGKRFPDRIPISLNHATTSPQSRKQGNNRMTTAVDAHSTLTLRPDGLPVITYQKPTRQSVDEWLAHVDTLLAAKPGEPLDYLLDHRQIDALPPLTYAVGAVREWLKRNPQHPPIRIASLHTSGMLLSMIDSMVSLLRANRVQLRFFTTEEEALRWLQSNK